MVERGDYTPTPPDAPEIELGEDFWRNARVVMPDERKKTSIHLRVDTDVLEWFKQHGRGHRAGEPTRGMGLRARAPPPTAHGTLPTEPSAAADAFQRPLRSRFWARLSASVRRPDCTLLRKE